MLGSVLPPAQPRADTEWGQHCARQPPARWGAGRWGSAHSGCSLFPPLPLCLSLCCSPQLPWGRKDPMGSAPLPVGSAGWDWSQGTGLVTTGTAWEVAAGGIQPLHPRSSPTAQLGAAAHACAPARGGGMSPVSSFSMSPLCVSALPVQSVPWGTQQATCEYARGLWAAPATSGFAFPSLDPGLFPRWWRLGLLWLRGHPSPVWGLRSSPAPQLLLQPRFGAGRATSPLGPCPGSLLGGLLCNRSVVPLSLPCLVTLSCCYLKVPLDLRCPACSLLPGVPVPGPRARWRGRAGSL